MTPAGRAPKQSLPRAPMLHKLQAGRQRAAAKTCLQKAGMYSLEMVELWKLVVDLAARWHSRWHPPRGLERRLKSTRSTTLDGPHGRWCVSKQVFETVHSA